MEAPVLVDRLYPGVDAVHVAVHGLGQRRRLPLVQEEGGKALRVDGAGGGGGEDDERR